MKRNLAAVFFSISVPALAQVPTITSFSPLSGPVATSVTINGTNFSGVAANNTVYFGGAKATVTNATTTVLTVTVPVGATYQPITVTVGGLTAFSARPFLVTFAGGTLTAGSFSSAVDLSTGNYPSHTAVADADGDGKLDILTSNGNGNSVSVFRNTNSPGSIVAGSLNLSFTMASGTSPNFMGIGDIDGDGKLDVGSPNRTSNDFALFRNTGTPGTISFASAVTFTDADPAHMAFADLDLDGKSDMVVTNLDANNVSVYRNIGTAGSLTTGSFASKQTFTTGTNPYFVSLADIDGDGKPEICTSNLSTSVSVLRNTSAAGSISFAAKQDFGSGSVVAVAAGDIDGDSKIDLVTSIASGSVGVLRSTSTVGTISFASQVNFAAGSNVLGVSINDMDGDGKPDVVASNNASNSISIFRNTSSPGTITFATRVDFTTGTAPSYNIAVGDIDGDGKPDMSMGLIPGSTLSVFRNLMVGGLASEPTTQASNLNITQPFANQLNLSWTNGNGTSRIVVGRQGGSVNQAPVDGQTYTANSSFSSGDDLSGGNYVVYSGSGNSASVTDITDGASYEFFVFEYNGSAGSENYLTSIATNNPRSFVIPAGEPATQPTNLTFTNLTPTGFTGNFTAATGNPDGYLVLMSANVAPDIDPVDGTAYTLNQILGTTSSGGNNIYAVFSGNGTTFNLGSLTPGTELFFKVYSYNGSGSGINYLTASPLSGSQYALANEPTVQASSITFSSVTATSMTVNYTNGNGTNRVLIGKAGSAVDASPSDGQLLTSGSTFGTSTQLGSGNYVLGTGSSPVTVFGLTPGTTYHFRVYEANGIPTSGANYLTTTATGNPASQATNAPSDATGPVLGTNSTPGQVAASTAVNVAVQFSDPETGVSSVQLEYGSFTVSGTQSVAMTLTGSTWGYTIASVQVGPLGIYYRFLATNGEGDVTTTPYGYVRIEHADEGLTIPYTSFGSEQSNYRIISIPLALEKTAIEDVFDELGPYDDKNYRVFTYQSGGYGELKPRGTFDFNLRPGKGYFFIARSSVGSIKTGPGTTVPVTAGTRYSLNLGAGWNLIGNPFNFDVPWTTIEALQPGIKLRVYNGNWSDGTVLAKMSGGFVMLGSATTVQIPAFAGGRVETHDEPMRNALDQPEWEVTFNLRSGDREYDLGGIGMRPDAAEGYDRYDDFTLPRLFEYIEINHDKELHGSAYSRDVVPTAGNREWSFMIESNSDDDFIDIAWDNSWFGENEKELVLWDVALQRPVDMRETTRYRLRKDQSREFNAFYGSADYIKERTAPVRLVFQDVYPNPASGPLTFRFAVPGGSTPVALEIFSLQGARVAQVSGALPSGQQEIVWEGRDMSGTPVPAGMYVAVVRSGATRFVKRFAIR